MAISFKEPRRKKPIFTMSADPAPKKQHWRKALEEANSIDEHDGEDNQVEDPLADHKSIAEQQRELAKATKALHV